MFCRNCGNALTENAKFCPECGSRCEEEVVFTPDPRVPKYRCRKCKAEMYNTPDKPVTGCEMCGSKDLEGISVQQLLGPNSSFARMKEMMEKRKN